MLKLIELVSKETGLDISLKTRKREVVEARALYCFIIKELKPKITFQKIADTLNLNHALIIHLLKMYPIYEDNNDALRENRISITKYFKDKNVDGVSVNEIKLQDKIDFLNEEIKKLTINNHKFEIINNLNKLMKDTLGTEKHELIQLRLDAFYQMNKIKL